MTVQKALRTTKGRAARLTLRLLGPPQIERDGNAVRFDTRKALGLLAYLAVTGRPHGREHLAALFWPEADEERARGALRRTLSAVRTGLAGSWLIADGISVALVTSGLALDIAEFRALLAAGRLADAVALYRGDFLAGFNLRDSGGFADWQSEQEDELRRELVDALARLAASEAATGSMEAALQHSRRWVALDPYAETAHRELMRLLSEAGDRTGALRQYAELTRVLDRELGVTPLAETRALHDAIRDGAQPAPRSGAARRVGVDEAIGDLHTLHGQYAKAIASYDSAAAAANGPTRAAIEHKLAGVHHRRGQWVEAEQHYRAALAAPDAGQQARVYADWSLAAHRRGDPIRARKLAEQGLTLARRARDDRALAQAHNILGILTADATHLERSLELAERLGDTGARVAALNNLALARGRAGDSASAIALTAAALAACLELGDRHREAALHNNMSDLLRASGRREDAMRHLKRAVAIFAEIGEPGGMEPEVWKLVEW